ncbi:MAG: hypothetical protein AAF799_35585 [Myxococcota bacterium]
MLNLESAVQMDGLTLYQDYSDPNLYYYMPDNPELARQGGEPLFQLLLYREDIADDPGFAKNEDRGGGFLTMTVDLKVSQTKLERIEQSLPSSGGPVKLVPVPYEAGRVRITALGTSAGKAGQVSGGAADDKKPPGLVEEVLGSATPSLYGDNRAVFSMELSHRGAVLMAASLMNDGATSIAVVYELDYMGLKPARDVKIVIEGEQVYEHLRSQATVNTLWFRSNIDQEMESLVKSNNIRIEDVDYLQTLEPAERTKREADLNKLAKELAMWTFFKPGLKPGEVIAKDRGVLKVYDPSTDAARVTAGFSTPLQTAATGKGNTGDTDGPRPQGKSALKTVTRVSGKTPAPAPTSTAGTPATNRPLTAVEKWNQAGRPQAGYLLRSLSQRERTRISYSMRTVSAHKRTIAPQGSIAMISGDANLPGRIQRVDLDTEFFQAVEGSVTTSAKLDEAGVTSMSVGIRYGYNEDGSFPKDTKEFVLDKTDEKKAFQFWMDDRRTTKLQYKVQVNYRADYAIGASETALSTDWIDTELRNLDIDPRAVQGLLPVRLTAGSVNWDSVTNIQAKVSYRDADSGIDASRTVVIKRDTASVLVPIRPASLDEDAYTVTSEYFHSSGNSETVEQSMDGSVTAVLNQPPSTAVPVRVRLSDPLKRLRDASVEMSYSPPGGGPDQVKLLSLGGDKPTSADWSFFRPSLNDDPRYRYRVTLFGANTVEEGQWQESTDRQLVVGDVFPGMLEVQVEMIGDLAAAGFAIAKLTLEYKGAAEGADNREEKTLRGTMQPFTWKVPSATREPGPFRYRVEYFRQDRTKVVDEAEVTAESLLLWVPSA